jgi:hypothetical protein
MNPIKTHIFPLLCMIGLGFPSCQGNLGQRIGKSSFKDSGLQASSETKGEAIKYLKTGE